MSELNSNLCCATYWLCDLGQSLPQAEAVFPHLQDKVVGPRFWGFCSLTCWDVKPSREGPGLYLTWFGITICLRLWSGRALSLFLIVVLLPNSKLQRSFLQNTSSTSISSMASTSFQDFLLMRAQWVWTNAKSSLIYNPGSAVINQGRPNGEWWIAWSGIARVGMGILVFSEQPVIKAFPFTSTIQCSPSLFLIEYEFPWQLRVCLLNVVGF